LIFFLNFKPQTTSLAGKSTARSYWLELAILTLVAFIAFIALRCIGWKPRFSASISLKFHRIRPVRRRRNLLQMIFYSAISAQG